MTLAEEFPQLALHIRDGIGRLRLDEKRAELGVAREPLHHAGVGHQDHIILVLSEAAGAFGLQPADDGEWGALDPNELADRIDVLTKQRIGRGAANQTNLAGIAHVRFGKIGAAAQRPGSGGQVFRADAGHLHKTVLVAHGDLD